MTMDDQQAWRYGQDTRERHSFSSWVRWVNSIYLLTILLMVLAAGRGWIILSDGIILALLGTTTANVLGLAYIILHGLFDK